MAPPTGAGRRRVGDRTVRSGVRTSKGGRISRDGFGVLPKRAVVIAVELRTAVDAVVCLRPLAAVAASIRAIDSAKATAGCGCNRYKQVQLDRRGW